jgi:hypothetical protein
MAGTRKNSRRRSPVSTTPTSVSTSPLFSKANSKATSPDSDIEFLYVKPAVKTTAVGTLGSNEATTSTKRKKRAAASDSEYEEASVTVSKRRIVTQQFYVELKSRKVLDKTEVGNVFFVSKR